jgi:hypothetical protein
MADRGFASAAIVGGLCGDASDMAAIEERIEAEIASLKVEEVSLRAEAAKLKARIAPLKGQQAKIVPLKTQLARLKAEVASTVPLKLRIGGQVTQIAEIESQTKTIETQLRTAMRVAQVPIVLAVLAKSAYKEIMKLPHDKLKSKQGDKLKPKQGKGIEKLTKKYWKLGRDSPDAVNWLTVHVCSYIVNPQFRNHEIGWGANYAA